VESVQQVGNDGLTITRTGAAESDQEDGPRPVVKPSTAAAGVEPVGPTIGPPPSGSHLPNAGEPRDVALRPGVVPHISRFASTGAVKWTRIRQILVEAGEDDVVGKISSFQEMLKDARQGEGPTPEELAETQEALVIQVEGMLTGQEVEDLLGDLREAVDSMKSAEAEAAAEE